MQYMRETISKLEMQFLTNSIVIVTIIRLCVALIHIWNKQIK